MIKKTHSDLIRDALYRGPDAATVTKKSGDQCTPRCRAQKFGYSGFFQCSNAGKVQRGALGAHWFCGVCDPIAREEKRAAKERAREAKWAERDAVIAKRARIEEAEAAVIEAAKVYIKDDHNKMLVKLQAAVMRLLKAEAAS